MLYKMEDMPSRRSAQKKLYKAGEFEKDTSPQFLDHFFEMENTSRTD